MFDSSKNNIAGSENAIESDNEDKKMTPYLPIVPAIDEDAILSVVLVFHCVFYLCYERNVVQDKRSSLFVIDYQAFLLQTLHEIIC